MKKVTAISFLLIFFSANTELHQLFKLPALVHHYLNHIQGEKDKSIFHFLDNHYSDNSSHSDNDHHEHDNLPFKKHDCTTSHISIFAIVNHIQITTLTLPTFRASDSPIYFGVIYLSAFLSNIWQPPQAC